METIGVVLVFVQYVGVIVVLVVVVMVMVVVSVYLARNFQE